LTVKAPTLEALSVGGSPLTHSLLEFSSTCLRMLNLGSCSSLSDGAILSLPKRFPFLGKPSHLMFLFIYFCVEELDLEGCVALTDGTVDAIVSRLPLKKFNCKSTTLSGKAITVNPCVCETAS